MQPFQPASAAISIPPNLVLTHTCLFSVNVLSVTVSKRRAEFCSSWIQVGSQSRVEFRRYRIQPGRLHCLHDPQPMLCVVPLLARNTCTAVDQAILPYFLVVLSMGLAYPDTTNPSRVAVGGRREELFLASRIRTPSYARMYQCTTDDSLELNDVVRRWTTEQCSTRFRTTHFNVMLSSLSPPSLREVISHEERIRGTLVYGRHDLLEER